MLTVSRRSWRYRAWAYTYWVDRGTPPERTSLCAMFWRTVVCWVFLMPLVIVLGAAGSPMIGLAPALDRWRWVRLAFGAVAALMFGAVLVAMVATLTWAQLGALLIAVVGVACGLGLLAGLLYAIAWLGAAIVKPLIMWVAPRVGRKIDDAIPREMLRAWKDKVCPLVQFSDDGGQPDAP